MFSRQPSLILAWFFFKSQEFLFIGKSVSLNHIQKPLWVPHPKGNGPPGHSATLTASSGPKPEGNPAHSSSRGSHWVTQPCPSTLFWEAPLDPKPSPWGLDPLLPLSRAQAHSCLSPAPLLPLSWASADPGHILLSLPIPARPRGPKLLLSEAVR